MSTTCHNCYTRINKEDFDMLPHLKEVVFCSDLCYFEYCGTDNLDEEKEYNDFLYGYEDPDTNDDR